jgi:hypothetical protein
VENRKKGNYFGTEVGGRWWRRYRGRGFFARGNGELWLDADGLHFRKYLTRTPLSIGWEEMTGARLGRWHGGAWGATRPILKIDFEREGLGLSAGFMLSRSWPAMEQLAADLRRRIAEG